MAKTVTNILTLSPTHFVSNIRHQHRYSRLTDNKIKMSKYGNMDGWIDGRKSVRGGLVFTANCKFNDRRLYHIAYMTWKWNKPVRTVRLNGVYTVLLKRWNWLYRLGDGYCVRRSRKIWIQSWPFVKLSRNRSEYFMMSAAGHSDEENRQMVQTAMPPRMDWISHRQDFFLWNITGSGTDIFNPFTSDFDRWDSVGKSLFIGDLMLLHFQLDAINSNLIPLFPRLKILVNAP